MYKIRMSNKQDIMLIAEFISNINSNKEHHIGFCGTNKLELISTLESDKALLRSFIMCYKEDQIKGLLGYDYYDNVVELWGPFVKDGYDFDEIAKLLWDNTIGKFPKGTEIQGFVNEENISCMNFYDRNNMRNKSKNEVLEYTLDSFNPSPVEFLSKEDYGNFIKLHDKLFPDTYYPGEEIVNMLDADNVILVSKYEDGIAGYCFVNVDSVLEGNIEYIAVNPEHRRKGHGEKLLKMALSWFKGKETEKLILCVGSDNTVAIDLYKKIGFKTKYALCSYYNKK